jgi:cell division septal protein FtsQ
MQKNKRIKKIIYIYIGILLILSTTNNKYFLKSNFLQNNKLEIMYLGSNENIKKNLQELNNKNLFFIKKSNINKKIKNEPIVDNFFIFKKYPSTLYVDIVNTKLLAITKKNENNYFIGSNGNLIEFYENDYDLPFVYGDVEINKFLDLMNVMNKLNFNYNEIKNLYYLKSKRWDIETKYGLFIYLPIDISDQLFETLILIIDHMRLENISRIDLRQKNQIILW